MNYSVYNEQLYNRKKLVSRLKLGVEHLCRFPFLNLLWLFFVVPMGFLFWAMQKIKNEYNDITVVSYLVRGCVDFIILVTFILFIIAIIYYMGEMVAKRDEARMELIFKKRDDENFKTPILMSKKINKKNGVTIREFYTIIPMKHWREKSEEICELFTIHLVGNMEHGESKENRIVIKSAKGREPKDRGLLYDDAF